MVSLALIPSGAERLIISHHLLGQLRLGITAVIWLGQACHAAQPDLPVKISLYNSWVLEC